MSDEAFANRKQYSVRNSSSHRVVHTTVPGLLSAEAKEDAERQLQGFADTHPEQVFEIVEV